MKELILRTLTGILLIILVAGSISLGPTTFLGILLLIYGLGLRELYVVFRPKNIVAYLAMALSAGFLMPLTLAVLLAQWSALFLIIPVVGWTIGFVNSGFQTKSLLILMWLAMPLTAFFMLGWIENISAYNSLLPLSVIVLVWINDTFAYVVGRMVGKHKMTPQLSAGKTWEGFVGGALFSMAGGWIIFRLSGGLTLWNWIIVSLIISIFGLWGDLFESKLKRRKSLKNMGALLPGHGGILDRFDSLLFVAPAVLILMILLRLIQ